MMPPARGQDCRSTSRDNTAQLLAMLIGDLLRYDRRMYVVRGFDPHGVTPRSIYLEDAVTGARLVMSLEHLDRALKRTNSRLRIVKEPDSMEPRTITNSVRSE
jgi:hypothetical protein